jgi:eukaryotic-like serine/threonine-protein kinase
MRPLGPADPATIARCRLFAELGAGGMGRVFLGCTQDGRLVALKRIHPQFADNPEFRVRFRAEVAASRKVSGAYTAAVVDADVDAPEPWLASVFVPGPALSDVVATVGTLPEDAVLRLAAGLASALVEVHRAGLVHRDLKPSNVLLADDGPRVIDFGIVRALDSQTTAGLTATGFLVGTPSFMSPEQVHGHPVTPASDVFSLGSVLVMAYTGDSPFTGETVVRVLYQVAHATPDLSALPARLLPIVTACLAKDPADRPTPAELLATIRDLAPAARPWPAAIHQLIDRQRADAARLTGAVGTGDTLRVPPTLTGPPFVPPAAPPPPYPPPVRRDARTAAVLSTVGIVAALAIIGTLFYVNRPASTTGAGATTQSSATQPDTTTPTTTDPDTTVPTTTVPDTTTPDTTTTTQAPAPPPPPPLPKCVDTDVTGAFVDFHVSDSGAAGLIQVTNIGDHACTIDGYGGAEFYSGGDGHPLGINLVRDTPAPVALTLQPGGTATKLLRWSPNEPGEYVPSCSAFPGMISVILPDDTQSIDIDVEDQNLPQVCDNDTVYGGGYQPG